MYGQACTYPGQARTLVKHVPWSSTYSTLVKHARHPGQACTYTGQARSLVKHVPWSSMYPGQACTLAKHILWASTHPGQVCTLARQREKERDREHWIVCERQAIHHLGPHDLWKPPEYNYQRPHKYSNRYSTNVRRP